MLRTNREKILRFIRKHYLSLGITLFLSIIDSLICSYKNEKFIEFEGLKEILAIAENLMKTPNKLRFISSHLFSGNNADLDEFVTKIGNDNFAKIISVEKGDESNVGTIKKREVTIKGVFWHESFIFKFLKNIQEFKPGFLRIASVDINKFAKVSLSKPVMKVEVSCDIYQK
jgi:hypothetical protein